MPVIEVNYITKEFLLNGPRAKYNLMSESLSFSTVFKRFKESKKEDNKLIALKNISFSVNKGEIIGIIGKNGAGKSTLLKILSRIILPTQGNVKIKGKLVSLLEVGTGFNPELTGRENIYLNGAIMGMTKEKIDKNFQSIVDFSGIERFIDTPVKKYSSGMYVRLAFSVAAHLDADIMLIDEVLSVGDIEFQQKSLGKMNNASYSGKTILFVSHRLSAIKRMCSKTILLENGEIVMFDKTDKVIVRYLNKGKETQSIIKYNTNNEGYFRIKAIELINHKKEFSTNFDIGHSFRIRILFEVKKDIINENSVVISVNDHFGNKIFKTFEADSDLKYYMVRKKGHYETEFMFPPNIFNEGAYRLNIFCGIPRKFIKDREKEKYFDLKKDINIYFYHGDSFFKDIFQGKRSGLLTQKIPSKTKKII